MASADDAFGVATDEDGLGVSSFASRSDEVSSSGSTTVN
jgi:hypothetical protein